MILGFFSFNKFLLWRDLEPKNWPDAALLTDHKVLRALLGPGEESQASDQPIIPADKRIDDVFKPSELMYVLDADSSQTGAIQAVLAGRNLVIQGPPGTGKSQTIANMIAAAIGQGKTVLFVAEKMVALEVVFDRLKKVGLGHVCFELHSRKASKAQVLRQLSEAIDAPTPSKVPSALGKSLDDCVDSLWGHSDRFHRQHSSGLTPYQVIGRISGLHDRKIAPPDFNIACEHLDSQASVNALIESCDELATRLKLSGPPAMHPWRNSESFPLSPTDQERLKAFATELADALSAMDAVLTTVWSLLSQSHLTEARHLTFVDFEALVRALQVAAARPAESVSVLANPRWATDFQQLVGLLDVARKLSNRQTLLADVFIQSAWSTNWSAIRAEIAASGLSPFRIMRGAYRNAIRAYRAQSKALPRGYHARVAALDSMIEGIELKDECCRRLEIVGRDLEGLADALPKDWQRLEKLTEWLHAALGFEPTFTVRNGPLLESAESPVQSAERLLKVRGRVTSALRQLGEFARLVEPDETAASWFGWSLGELRARAQGWAQVERFSEWPPVRDGLRTLAKATDQAFVERCRAGAVQPTQIADLVALAAFDQVWRAMTAGDPQLALADGRMLDDTVARFRSLDRSRVTAASQEVARSHYDQRPTGSVGDMGVIRAELNKSRRHLPVRKLLERAGPAVQQLKPAFLMSPLSVAQFLSPGRMHFDLLVIDEASQVRPADALGAIVRANQVVVVGDPKQLPPTNFFNRVVDDDDTSSTDDDDVSPHLGSMESILSLCDSVFTHREMLRWHYRSEHPALIAVSNKYFYDDKLLLPPSIMATHAGDGLGIEFHLTPRGGYARGRTATNVAEAELVAEAVCRFAKDYPTASLGVGTFSVAQRDVIQDLVDDKRRREPDLEPFFSTNRRERFFVKNLESIQGDERDAIFISVGYGHDSDGRPTQTFGPINADGGERRLNVLISRARRRCEVFSPITADDIDISNRKLGVVALRAFLQYAQKGYFDVAQQARARTFDSDFEESVANFLIGRGFQVHPQVGVAGFYIDIGVLDPLAPHRFLMGIECDGATYHGSRSARDRDRIRQDILEKRGWSIYRIWSTDWFHRRTQEEARLIEVLSTASRPAHPPPPAGGDVPYSPPIPPPTQRSDRNKSRAPRETTIAYEEATFCVRTRLAPHEAPADDVDEAMRRIIEIEGPVHQDEACRRLATVWGLERAGSRIQQAGIKSLRRLRGRGDCANEGKFWTLTAAKERPVRNRSGTSSIGLRRAEYLPPTEIVAAASAIVSESVRVGLDELVTETARRFGFLRTGQDLQEVIERAIASAIGTKFTKDAVAMVSLLNAGDA